MKRHRRAKLAALLAVTLGGSTVFGTCQTRIHDSIINGAQLVFLSLFDPSNLVINPD